ncbi:MAG: branched-chain amino acid ABC transporter permease [Acidimicrobiia bacterium]|nr:branched-chain amino acid ABC transporter permease [Actinomycetota bacterium]MBL6924594.1 branched-chain amino acid ABC transporter permease [Acidimicrobiia bacterium]
MSKRKFKSIRQTFVRSRRPLHQWRQVRSDRHAFARRAYVNPRTLRREREFVDERTFWWAVALVLFALLTVVVDNRTALNVMGIFAIYAAINIMWALVMGSAGVFSLGTLAIVGTSGFIAGRVALETGLPWYVMLVVGAVTGAVMGVVIGVPAQRLDGMYYALLTLGVVEVARTFFKQSRGFGSASGGLISLPTYLSKDQMFSIDGLRIRVLVALVPFVLVLVLYRVLEGRRLGLLLRTTRDSEAYGDAIGVDLVRIRLSLFVISSSALGMVGGFFAAYNRSMAPSVFDMGLLLLMFAMVVVGGVGSAEGVVIGTALVVFVHNGLISIGPIRIIGIGVVVVLTALFTKGGLYGIPGQYRRWRDKHKSERIAAASQRQGDLTSEEAALTDDKDLVAVARFNDRYRWQLRELVTEAVVAEHQARPVGRHSPELDRLLNYFRKGELADKYAVMTVEPFSTYRVVALSGVRGIPPREVDEKVYGSLDDAYHAVFLRRIHDLMES